MYSRASLLAEELRKDSREAEKKKEEQTKEAG
jgi:hypothetical protein